MAFIQMALRRPQTGSESEEIHQHSRGHRFISSFPKKSVPILEQYRRREIFYFQTAETERPQSWQAISTRDGKDDGKKIVERVFVTGFSLRNRFQVIFLQQHH